MKCSAWKLGGIKLQLLIGYRSTEKELLFVDWIRVETNSDGSKRIASMNKDI